MQPVLQGYLGLLQGEKLYLFSIKNDRKTTMVIYMASWFLNKKKTKNKKKKKKKKKKHKRFNFIIFLTVFSS